MTKAILSILMLAFACGAPLPEDQALLDQEALELAQTEQPVSVVEPYGVRTDRAAPAEADECTLSTQAPLIQACNYPAARTVNVRCGSGFTAAELNLCNSFVAQRVGVAAWRNQFPAWTIGSTTQGGNCIINKGALGGTGSTDIRTFVQTTLSGVGASLTEPQPNGYPGTYRKFSTITATVDWARIDASGVSQPLRVKGHSVYHVIASCLGAGSTSRHTSRDNSQRVTATDKSIEYDTGDKCRINNYDPSGTTITIGSGC